jgi:surfeit locus 1 family protein
MLLHRLRQARLLWPTLLAMAGLAFLIGLGHWQLERKAWKEGLLAKIAARIDAPPVPLARAEQAARSGGDVEYEHVAATGRFHYDKERYLYAPTQAGLGWHVYTPLEIDSGRVVWINRGLVPDASKAPAARPAGQVEGEVEVAGLVRIAPAKALFAPANDVGHNLWYWPEIEAMTASAFAPGSVTALPFFVDADARPLPPGGLPKGGVTRIVLPNRHLEYAVTWFGLAATLIGVYLAFAISRLRVDVGE